jgi:hypothetical protein
VFATDVFAVIPCTFSAKDASSTLPVAKVVSGAEEDSLRLRAIGTFTQPRIEPVDEIINFLVAHPLRPLLTTQRHLNSTKEGSEKVCKEN